MTLLLRAPQVLPRTRSEKKQKRKLEEEEEESERRSKRVRHGEMESDADDCVAHHAAVRARANGGRR